MNITLGLALIAITVAMILVARPRDGVSAQFLKVWIVGQIYLLAAMVSAIMGITLVIFNW